MKRNTYKLEKKTYKNQPYFWLLFITKIISTLFAYLLTINYVPVQSLYQDLGIQRQLRHSPYVERTQSLVSKVGRQKHLSFMGQYNVLELRYAQGGKN